MILIVDDQPDTGKLLGRLLDRCGYQSCYCESASAALEVCAGIRPELAILDVMMPGMDGLTLLKALRDDPDLAGLPVVMYSASTDEHHQRQANELRAESYLIKGTVSIVELLGVVTRYITPAAA